MTLEELAGSWEYRAEDEDARSQRDHARNRLADSDDEATCARIWRQAAAELREFIKTVRL